MHGDIGSYIAHVIVRGVIYKFIFRLGVVPTLIIGAVALYFIIRRQMAKRRKVNK